MKKAFIIGIAGGSASGKSTFCDSLEKSLDRLKTMVIHMDTYFKPEAQRPYQKAPVTKKMYTDDNHPESMDLQRLLFDQISDVYLDMVRYRHDEYVEASKWRADLILNGSAPSEKALAIISDAVYQKGKA